MDLERGPCFEPKLKNQETRCDSSLSTEHHSMAVHLTSSDCEGFYRKCCVFNAVDGSEEDGDVRSERKI